MGIFRYPIQYPLRTITYKTVVSAFTPSASPIINQTVATSPEFFNDAIRPFYTSYTDFNAFNTTFNTSGSCSNTTICSSSTITVQNLSSFAVEQVPNNPLVEKNTDLGFTLRYGNLDTVNPVASSSHINVFPFSSQNPPRSPATSFSGNLSFKGLVVAPNSGSIDPAVVNTNDNITGGAGGTVQYTKTVSSSIASDPCDVSNNPSGVAVNTNPRCAGVDPSVIGTGATIWCTASLDPATPSIKSFTILGTTGTTGASASSCPSSLAEVTAFRLVTGSLPIASGSGGTIFEVKANFSTNGNTNGNIYTNLSQARAQGIATVATSNSAVSKVTSGTISGNIFNDKDKNGVRDILAPIANPNFDPGLPTDPITNPATIPNPTNDFDLSGVTVELRYGTGNLDGSGNPITANTLIETKTTDSTGNYTFPNTSSGNYTVVVLQNGIPLSNQTKDPDTTLDNKTNVVLTYTNGVGVNNVSGLDFAYNQYSKVTGKLYADANNNGIQDTSNTTEPDFNTTTNVIPTGTSVVITTTSNPSITYTLTTTASATQVGGFTTSSIAANGTFSQDLPVGEYTVTVSTSNPKYTISTSTELGDSTGANPSTLILSFGETKSAGSDGLYLIQIQNTDIASISCTPSTVNINGTTDCTLTLASGKNFNALSGSIDFKIGNSGTVKNCVLPASGTSMSCTALTVGGSIGIYPAQYKGSGTASSFVTGSSVSNITVLNPLTQAQLPGLTITCQAAPANSTTTCTFTLPPNTTLPPDFKIAIGDGALGGTCTVTNTTTGQVTCTNVPTGSLTGSQPIKVQIGTGTTVTTTQPSGAVSNPIQSSNISSVVCQTPKLINQTTDCVVTYYLW